MPTKVTTAGNLRLEIGAFSVMTSNGPFHYGGGEVESDDNSTGYVVLDSITGEPSIIPSGVDSAKIYLAGVQSAQGKVRVIQEFLNAPYYAGDAGGGSNAAPRVIAPAPASGVEDGFYHAQIYTTGSLPQKFEAINGALPPSVELNADTGVMAGTVAYPNGGLYPLTVRVTNAVGSVDYPFSILIAGMAPKFTLTYDNTTVQFNVPVKPSEPTEVSGSQPITFTVSKGGLVPGLTLEPSGKISGTPNDPASVGSAYTANVVAKNQAGARSTVVNSTVVAPIFWGLMDSKSLPAEFTDRDARGLMGLGLFASPEVAVLDFKAIAADKNRVFILPDGFLTGNVASALSTDWFPTVDGETPVKTQPQWPQARQTGLVIDGVPYKVYVIPGWPGGKAFDLKFSYL